MKKLPAKNRDATLPGLVLEQGRKKTKGVYIYLSDLTQKELQTLATYTADSISSVVEKLIRNTYLATSEQDPQGIQAAEQNKYAPRIKD